MEDRRLFSIVISLMLVSVFIVGCSNPQAYVGDTPDQGLEESISEADTAKEDFNQTEIDSEVNTLEQDFSNW